MKRQHRYGIGFLLAVFLTIESYLIVSRSLLHGSLLIAALVVMAAVQLYIQLFLFLHLGEEEHPRWRLTAFLFMLMVVGILVFGTLWIMKSLDYRHPVLPSDESIIKDEGAHQ